MAGKRRGARSTAGRDKIKAPPEYYVTSKSDLAYAAQAHERARHNGLRTWLIRLALVLGVLLVWHLWGPQIVRAIRGQGQATADQVKAVSKGIQEGRDRRTGVGLDESP